MRFRSLTSVLVLGLFLASCSSFSPNMRKIYKSHTKSKKITEKLLKKMNHPENKADMSHVRIRDDVYIGTRVDKKSSASLLPAITETGKGITLMNAKPLYLQGIAEMITDATEISVAFSRDIIDSDFFQGGKKKGRGGRGGNAQSMLLKSLTLSVLEPGQMRVNYHGALSGFLDHVAGYYDIGWSYKKGSIRFFQSVTRTFSVAAMPSKVTSSSSMSSGIMGTGGSIGGASVSAGINVSFDFWADMKNTIKSIIGKVGKFTINKSDGTVTVTAPYDITKRIGNYIDRLNVRLLRQILIKVEVYNVTIDAQTLMQFTPEALFRSAKYVAGFGGSGAIPSINPLSILGTSNGPPVSPLSTAPNQTSLGGAGLSGGLTTGKFKGSNGFIQLGDTLDKINIVTSTSVTTMSGQPVPLQVGNTRGYISSIQTVANDTGTTTTVSTGTISTGFSLNVLPRVMDDGQVLLQYAINISEPVGGSDGFIEVAVNSGTGSTKMQLIDVNQHSFIQQALINDGQSLILAGFNHEKNSSNDSGSGSPSFKLLGGGYGGSSNKQMLIIKITPIVLDHSSTAKVMKANADADE